MKKQTHSLCASCPEGVGQIGKHGTKSVYGKIVPRQQFIKIQFRFIGCVLKVLPSFPDEIKHFLCLYNVHNIGLGSNRGCNRSVLAFQLPAHIWEDKKVLCKELKVLVLWHCSPPLTKIPWSTLKLRLRFHFCRMLQLFVSTKIFSSFSPPPLFLSKGIYKNFL